MKTKNLFVLFVVLFISTLAQAEPLFLSESGYVQHNNDNRTQMHNQYPRVFTVTANEEWLGLIDPMATGEGKDPGQQVLLINKFEGYEKRFEAAMEDCALLMLKDKKIIVAAEKNIIDFGAIFFGEREFNYKLNDRIWYFQQMSVVRKKQKVATVYLVCDGNQTSGLVGALLLSATNKGLISSFSGKFKFNGGAKEIHY